MTAQSSESEATQIGLRSCCDANRLHGIQLCQQSAFYRFELSLVRRRNGLRIRQGDSAWIFVHPVHSVFVVQVRTSGSSCAADVADQITLLDSTSDAKSLCEAREVTIERRNATAVLQYDRVAV